MIDGITIICIAVADVIEESHDIFTQVSPVAMASQAVAF
jgi:hypothetical protein